jgi:hypothetical protein
MMNCFAFILAMLLIAPVTAVALNEDSDGSIENRNYPPGSYHRFHCVYANAYEGESFGEDSDDPICSADEADEDFSQKKTRMKDYHRDVAHKRMKTFHKHFDPGQLRAKDKDEWANKINQRDRVFFKARGKVLNESGQGNGSNSKRGNKKKTSAKKFGRNKECLDARHIKNKKIHHHSEKEWHGDKKGKTVRRKPDGVRTEKKPQRREIRPGR